MSSRRSDIPGTADPVLNSLTAETAVQLLLQIPTIMAVVGEIRQILAGRQKPLLTIEEFGALTGRAPYTVRRWVKERRIRAIRVSGTGPKGRLLIPREELEKLVTSGLAGQVVAAMID
jgi:excisionase family DNA binding protein